MYGSLAGSSSRPSRRARSATARSRPSPSDATRIPTVAGRSAGTVDQTASKISTCIRCATRSRTNASGQPWPSSPGEAGEPRARVPERQHLRPQVQEPDVGVPAQRRRQRPRVGVRTVRRPGRARAAGHQRDQRPRRRIRPEQLERQLLGVGRRDVVERDDQQQPDREVRERRAVRERERIRGRGRLDLAQPGPDGRLPEVNPDDGHRTHPVGYGDSAASSGAGSPAAGVRRSIWISAITSANDP